jgi:hypothetical protein
MPQEKKFMGKVDKEKSPNVTNTMKYKAKIFFYGAFSMWLLNSIVNILLRKNIITRDISDWLILIPLLILSIYVMYQKFKKD